MTYEEAVQEVTWDTEVANMNREMDRIEAECSAELPSNLSFLKMRAEAVLNSDDPPRGDDANFCLALVTVFDGRYHPERKTRALRQSNNTDS